MVNLRPLEPHDAAAVFAAVDCSRDALRRWMVWYRDSYDAAGAEQWIQQAQASHAEGTAFHFAIREGDDRLVGVLSFEDMDPATGRAMLGYWVATPFTGRGIGKRAIEHALTWARRDSGIRVVWALVAETNERSRRVVEANGFKIVEVRERDALGDVLLLYELSLDGAPSA